MNELNNYALMAVGFWNAEHGLALAQVVLFCGLARTLILGSTSGLISLVVASSFPALVPYLWGELPSDFATSLLLVLHAWYAAHLLVVLVFMPYCLFLLAREIVRFVGGRVTSSGHSDSTAVQRHS